MRSEGEAVKFSNRLFQNEPYFSQASSCASFSSSSTDDDDLDDDYSVTSPASNIFEKRAHSRGLDVEKLYFSADSRNDHFLLFGIKAAGVAVPEHAKQIYQSFPLQIGKSKSICICNCGVFIEAAC